MRPMPIVSIVPSSPHPARGACAPLETRCVSTPTTVPSPCRGGDRGGGYRCCRTVLDTVTGAGIQVPQPGAELAPQSLSTAPRVGEIGFARCGEAAVRLLVLSH